MQELVTAARGLPGRGRANLFLGDPLSDGNDKTTVGPGNTYSPGVWTCGISVWIETGGGLSTPDLLGDDEIEWTFGGGFPPVVESRYTAGGGISVVHRLCHLGAEGTEGVDFNEIELSSTDERRATLSIVVRDVGPAGGRIRSLEWDETSRTLLVIGINSVVRLIVEKPGGEPEAVCTIAPAEGEHDSPLGIISFEVALKPGAVRRLSFKTEHGFEPTGFLADIPLRRPHARLSVEEGLRKCARDWRDALPARVFCPDERVARAWERCAFHMMAAMECGLPRIGAVTYPVFWIRDCVIVLRALDLLGRHDLARAGNDYLAPLYFSGGFGAESDAPGEGIWSLVSHARLSGDTGWLREVFPHLKRRVGFLEEMLAADAPIRRPTENRLPRYVNSPGVNVLCLPSAHGLIRGRMDWHSPDFYVNCWARAGFDNAAFAARRLGHGGLATEWEAAAERLDERIAERLLPHYGNPRDAIVTPYPTGALGRQRPALREAFRKWYRKTRLDEEGERVPEALWTYFEAAQIHNAFLLGLRDEAWVNLDGVLAPAGTWDVSAYVEGKPGSNEFLPFRNDLGRRGWLDPERALGGNMPHNWTSGEMVNMIRDLFVCEEGDTLVLGLGVPKEWLAPGSRFGVSDLPTDLGPVSYCVQVARDGSVALEYSGPERLRVLFTDRPDAVRVTRTRS